MSYGILITHIALFGIAIEFDSQHKNYLYNSHVKYFVESGVYYGHGNTFYHPAVLRLVFPSTCAASPTGSLPHMRGPFTIFFPVQPGRTRRNVWAIGAHGSKNKLTVHKHGKGGPGSFIKICKSSLHGISAFAF